MSEAVVFEDDQSNQVANIRIVPGAPTGMLAWVVKNKIAKNAKQAEMFLLVVAIVAAVLAIGIFVFLGNGQTRTFTAAEKQNINNLKGYAGTLPAQSR